MKGLVISIVFCSVFLASCNLDWQPGGWSGGTGEGGVEVSTELFRPTGLVNEWIFSTNDTTNALPYGKSFWYPAEDSQEPFERWSLIATKDGGERYAGYGMILCHGSRECGEDGEERETMLTVMIRCDGYFQVAEVLGTDYRPFENWLPNDAIEQEYGRENKLTVEREANGVFTLLINDIDVYRFVDDEEPYHSGGTQGFLAVVSPHEDFPDFPVTIRYRLP